MVKTPHRKSMAALVLLCRKYAEQELAHWLDFRARFLETSRTEDGKLVCAYCGRDDLVPDMEDHNGRQPANLATIDHVVPVSKGGKRFEEDNLAVACYACNQKKANNEV